MAEIRDSSALRDWLNGRAPGLACVLAARVALRAAPVLEIALHEDGRERCRDIILPWFRALAASGFAGAWPRRMEEVHRIARSAGQDAGSAVSSLAFGARMTFLEARDAGNDEEEAKRCKNEADALSAAQHAVDAAVEAAHSVNAAVEAEKGTGGQTAVYEAAVSAAETAHIAIDGIHGQTEFFEGPEKDNSDKTVAPHIKEFWNAVTLDVEWLESSENARERSEETAAGLSEKALWLGGTPVWASRRWAGFRDRLPHTESWQVWIEWYEARLAGRKLDAVLEIMLLTIPDEDWAQGPAHVNAIIADLTKSLSNPRVAAMMRVFEELEEVRQNSSIDLARHIDRIKNALPDDPRQMVRATIDMLETTTKTVLYNRGIGETDSLGLPDLLKLCLTEFGRSEIPPTEAEKRWRKLADNSSMMNKTINEFRNLAGSGHEQTAGEDPILTAGEASFFAIVGYILAIWLLRQEQRAE